MFKEKLSKITTRIFYIIIAVIVSVALWLYVEITENERQKIEVSGVGIVYKNEEVLSDRGLLISAELTESLSFTFEGSRSDTSTLALPNAISVEVDLANVTSTGPISLAYVINFPQGVSSSSVEILGRSTNRVTVVIDRVLSRQIPVRVNSYMGGTASEELVAEAIDFDPQFITVRGPEEVVSRIHHVRVPIYRENLSATTTDDLEFMLFDVDDDELDNDLRSSLEFSHDTIRVTIPIREIKDVILSAEFVHGTSTSSSNVAWRVEPSSIKISGDPEVIRDINNIMLGTIDMLRFGLTDTIAFPIILPNHIITNISGETEALVHVDVLGLEIAHVSTSHLFAVNPPLGFRAEVLTQSLVVSIRGLSDELAQITPLNIRVVADVTDMSPGTSRVSARVYIHGVDVNIDPVGEYELTVSIIADIAE